MRSSQSASASTNPYAVIVGAYGSRRIVSRVIPSGNSSPASAASFLERESGCKNRAVSRNWATTATVNELPVIRREAVARQRRETREAGQARGAFDGELRRLGLTARSDVELVQVPAPAAVAELLGVDEGTTVLARRRRMYANDTPVQMATSYLPLDIAAGTALASSDPGPGGTYSRLADLGHALATYAETARVRPPDDDETQFLHMDPDQRVVAIRRTARTTSGRTVEDNEITLPAHQWELVYEWPAE